MSINVRRVVTGHDDQGRAKVLIDETVKNVASQRPGALYSVIWSSEGFPVSNDGDADPSGKKSARRFPMERCSALSASALAWRRATIVPIQSTMRLSCRVRLIWNSTSEKCTSRPAMCWSSVAPSTTG